MGQVLDEIYFTVGKETSSNLKAASNLINCGCQCSRSSNVWGWSLMRSWPLIILVINFLDNLQWGGDHIDDLRWGWPSMRLIRSYWWSASLDLKCQKQSHSLTFVDSAGQVQGNCRTVDSTGARWCYTSHGSTCQVLTMKLWRSWSSVVI